MLEFALHYLFTKLGTIAGGRELGRKSSHRKIYAPCIMCIWL